MTEKKAATVASAYKAMKNPAKPGQIRRKAWSTIMPPSGPTDPLWAERCRNYWEHQQQLYGLKISGYTFYYDLADETVVTESVVMSVLPGQRIDY